MPDKFPISIFSDSVEHSTSAFQDKSQRIQVLHSEATVLKDIENDYRF